MGIASKKSLTASLLIAAMVVLLMLLATQYLLRQARQEQIRQAAIHQQSALKVFWVLVRQKGSEFRIRNGQLLAGDCLLNGNNQLPDQVRDITGSNATIFQGDTRVATTIQLADGRRAIGTKLVGPAYDAIFRKGIPFRGETQILGGTYFTAYDPIRDPSGKIIGVLFVGSTRSESLAAYHRTSTRLQVMNGALGGIFIAFFFVLMAERRRSEDAIQRQLQFLQVIIDTIPSPIFYKDAEGKYLGFNETYEAFVGLTRDQMLGKTVHELWQKDLADKYWQMDQELLRQTGVQVYESSVRYADGTLHHVVFNKAAFRNSQGAVGGLVGVILDITERKAAEEESKNAYQRIADILEFLPDATFVVDRDRRVIAWNRAIEVLTGIPKEEILGQGDHAYALPFYGERREILIDLLDRDPESQRRVYPDLIRDGKTLSIEKRVTLRGGEERHLWGAATPLYDRQGNQVGGIQTLRDVTELRRAEQQRSMLEAQLHHSSLMESLLVQLGHDLKTPLTPLLALLPMVRRKVADPALDQMLEVCHSSADQIHALTIKALDLVRVSSKALAPESAPVPVGLAGVAARSLQGCAALFARRGITCLMDIDAGVTVLGAEKQLTLLFDNLLSNAARYGAENGVVRIAAVVGDGAVTVSVRDDGVGLEPGHVALIFDEFFKGDQARHDLSTQGLGLAICRRIVGNHNGRIWAESPGKGLGTTIYLTLRPVLAAETDRQTGK